DGSLDHDAAEQVATRTAAYGLHALLAQSEHASGLSFRRNTDRDLAVERRHADRGAKCGGREADRHLTAQVLAVPLEDRMLADVDLDIQVARRSAVAACLAFPGQTDAVACIDARGHFHRQLARAPYPALPVAGIAGILDDRAG